MSEHSELYVYDEADLLNGATSLIGQLSQLGEDIPQEAKWLGCYSTVRFLFENNGVEETLKRNDINHDEFFNAVKHLAPDASENLSAWTVGKREGDAEQIEEWGAELINAVDANLESYAHTMPQKVLSQILQKGAEENSRYKQQSSPFHGSNL